VRDLLVGSFSPSQRTRELLAQPEQQLRLPAEPDSGELPTAQGIGQHRAERGPIRDSRWWRSTAGASRPAL